MMSNLDRYKKDLDKLIAEGDLLHIALQRECLPEEFERVYKKELGAKWTDVLKKLPSFASDYQKWYSEAKALVRQLLPDRLADFTRHYEKPKRKDITYESYRIEDCLQGLHVKFGGDKIAGPDAAIPHFRQQQAILGAIKQRFESSLFDIQQLVQADLFDSELDAAKGLAKSRFFRAAGAVSGVILEKHLNQVCTNHGIAISKKAPTLADLNEALKQAQVTELEQWRFIQHLADVRNLCAHDKQREPTEEQVADLIAGVAKIIKTLF